MAGTERRGRGEESGRGRKREEARGEIAREEGGGSGCSRTRGRQIHVTTRVVAQITLLPARLAFFSPHFSCLLPAFCCGESDVWRL
eukprot:3715280-Rhodomonas_salina.1